MGDRHCGVNSDSTARVEKMRKVLVAMALIVGLASCLPSGDKPLVHSNDIVPEDKPLTANSNAGAAGTITKMAPPSMTLQKKKAKLKEAEPKIVQPGCNKNEHKCTNNADRECDTDSDCGKPVAVHEAAPPPPKTRGCNQKKGYCYQDEREHCKVDANCDAYKCKEAPSQWIALVLAMSPFAPLGAAFAYISRWGLMALYLNATFLPCVISCILVCCFQPKLEDEAYRMPTAVWIMVFWGVLQAILYIWAVWVFGENGFDAGGDFEGCLLRDNWNW